MSTWQMNYSGFGRESREGQTNLLYNSERQTMIAQVFVREEKPEYS